MASSIARCVVPRAPLAAMARAIWALSGETKTLSRVSSASRRVSLRPKDWLAAARAAPSVLARLGLWLHALATGRSATGWPHAVSRRARTSGADFIGAVDFRTQRRRALRV